MQRQDEMTFRNLYPPQRCRLQAVSVLRSASSAQLVLIAQPAPVAQAEATASLKDHPVYAELAAQTGVPLFADGWSSVLSRAEWRSDPIHANAQGYSVFADRLAAWLRLTGFVS